MLNILHLPHRTDRRLSFERELKSQGIVDYKVHHGTTEGKPITNVSRGHKKIIAEAKDQGIPFVVVAEDDIKFTHPNSYRRFLETMPMDCDIYLGCIYSGEIKTDNTVEDFGGFILYAVMERFYDTFLAVNERENVDRAMRGKGRFVVANPFVATQYPGYSNRRNGFYIRDDEKIKGRALYNGED